MRQTRTMGGSWLDVDSWNLSCYLDLFAGFLTLREADHAQLPGRARKGATRERRGVQSLPRESADLLRAAAMAHALQAHTMYIND